MTSESCVHNSEFLIASCSKIQDESSINYCFANPYFSSVFKLLNELTDDDLRNNLEVLISNIENELNKSRSECEDAKTEVAVANKRLHEMELELKNVSSATSMLLADQRNEILAIKRKYEEESASFFTMAQQGLLDRGSESNHNATGSPIVPVQQPLNSTNEDDQLDSPMIKLTDKHTAQSLANQALGKVEKMVRLVSFKTLFAAENFNLGKTTANSNVMLAAGSRKKELEQNDPLQHVSSSTSVVDNCSSSNEVHSTDEIVCDLTDLPDVDQQVVEKIKNVLEKEFQQQYALLSQELQSKSIALSLALERQVELQTSLKAQITNQSSRTEKLVQNVGQITSRIESLLNNFNNYKSATDKQLVELEMQRSKAHYDFELLRNHYDALIGRRARAASELSAQPIQLPSDKDDLELMALNLHEENIIFREAREHLDDRLQSMDQFHRQQLLAEHQERSNIESTFQQELQDAHKRLTAMDHLIAERDKLAHNCTKLEEGIRFNKTKYAELQAKYAAVESNFAQSQNRVQTLQQQVMRLQADLDNNESVQGDFVRLSQSLQVQLERLRQADNEVRWVDPDDAATCYACNKSFPGSSCKNNCRHCGKVHCAACLQHTVPSGPYGRASVVCNVCHTLLNKHVAPFFSTIGSTTQPKKDQLESVRQNSVAAVDAQPVTTMAGPT